MSGAAPVDPAIAGIVRKLRADDALCDLLELPRRRGLRSRRFITACSLPYAEWLALLEESNDVRLASLKDGLLLQDLTDCREALRRLLPQCKARPQRRAINRLLHRIEPLADFLGLMAEDRI